MAESISIAIGLEGGDDVRKTLEEIVGGVDDLKDSAEALGKLDATVKVKAEGADGAKDSIDGVKGAAEELNQTDATVKIKTEGADAAKEVPGLLDPISQSATVLSGSIDALTLSFSKLGSRMTRSLGSLGVVARTLGPAGIAAGVFAAVMGKSMSSAVNAIEELNSAALKLNVTVEALSRVHAALEGVGISPQAVTSGIENLKSVLDKLKLERVARDAESVKKAIAGGGSAGEALKRLQKTAQEFTPEGEAAAKALQEMGQPIPGLKAKDIEKYGIELTKLKAVIEEITGEKIELDIDADPIAAMEQFIELLAQMPDDARRTQLAFKLLGESLGTELLKSLKAGTFDLKKFTATATKNAQDLKRQADQADAYNKSFNKLSAAFRNLNSLTLTPALTGLFDFLTPQVERFERGLVNIGRVLTWLGGIAAEIWNDPLGALDRFARAFADFSNDLDAAIWDAIVSGATTAWDWVVQKIAEAKQAVVDFAGAVVTIAWDAITTGAAVAWDWVKQKVAEAKQAVVDFAGAVVTIAWDAITTGADYAWEAIKQGAADAKQAILDFGAALPGIAWDIAIAGIQMLIDKVKELFGLRPTGAGGGAPAPALARGGFIGGRGTRTSDSNLAWLSRGEYIMPARVVAQPGVASFLEALRRSGRIPGFAAGGFAAGGSVGFVTAQSVEQIVGAINQLAESIAGAFQQVAREQTLTTGINIILQAIGGKGMARGGLLGGRGTGTSDSNLAWVSRGEHIMPARAVRQPGVLAFLEALRRSGGNLAAVLDGMGRFALGGMVPRAIPAFAAGGLAGGMSNVTIQFPGLPAIGGLRASSGVVGELQKAAALAQVRSGGRKPSRYS